MLIPRPLVMKMIALAVAVALPLSLGAAAQSTPLPSTPGPSATPGPSTTTAAPASVGEVEALYRAARYDRAIARCDELRAAAGGGSNLADVESEYWAAKASQSLGANDDARARLRTLARVHADSPRAADALIDAPMIGIDVQRGHTSSTKEREAAAAAAGELEALAPTLSSNPGSVARAWFVAGNAWRVAENDAKARKDYETSQGLKIGEYPMKAQHMLSVVAGRGLDAEGARALLTDCVAHSANAQQERCAKDLDRWSIVGAPAPELSVETWIHGEPTSLEQLRGKVVLIWFFATWCPHCKATMPEMADLQARMAGKPFRIIGITRNDQGQTTESAKTFVLDPKWKITYPVGVDKDAKTSTDFHGMAVPSAILIDKKGVVRWSQHPGYLSDALIDKLVSE